MGIFDKLKEEMRGPAINAPVGIVFDYIVNGLKADLQINGPNKLNRNLRIFSEFNSFLSDVKLKSFDKGSHSAVFEYKGVLKYSLQTILRSRSFPRTVTKPVG